MLRCVSLKKAPPACNEIEGLTSNRWHGKKPEAVAQAMESTQQKLDRMWAETANAWDCNCPLEEELDKTDFRVHLTSVYLRSTRF